MDMFALQPIQPAASLFQIQNLELAPTGWRHCVEKIAEGFAEMIGDHAYCVNCGGALTGVQGHDASCVTMLARRILTNEPLLHACHKPASINPNIDTTHVSGAAGVDMPLPIRRSAPNLNSAPHVEIPTFLPNPHATRTDQFSMNIDRHCTSRAW